jgi:hypothetical protein
MSIWGGKSGFMGVAEEGASEGGRVVERDEEEVGELGPAEDGGGEAAEGLAVADDAAVGVDPLGVVAIWGIIGILGEDRAEASAPDEGPGHAFACEGFDVAGGVSDAEEALGGEVGGASGEEGSPFPVEAGDLGDWGEAGVGEDPCGEWSEPTGLGDGAGVERGGDIEATIFESDEADVAFGGAGHVDGVGVISVGDGGSDGARAEFGMGCDDGAGGVIGIIEAAAETGGIDDACGGDGVAVGFVLDEERAGFAWGVWQNG